MRRKQWDERRRPCSLARWLVRRMGIGAGGGGGGRAHQDGCGGSSWTNDGAPCSLGGMDGDRRSRSRRRQRWARAN
ncbi:Os02g0551000 [Oryza sativa Japonica Group]|uniref:Os02g0551000 protein n=1 Tax=Oryza sativa subsp. japonica TaxID=39947 RepID=A0A0P0VKF0_ORYSJ|nr:Os02g0551000 [Oryza sativa Japonica Group]